ncbi:Uncharacterised protein [Streptococcus pneumoniae]|nr:Uncharacterised protein [Streptococcus pneumoniae]
MRILAHHQMKIPINNGLDLQEFALAMLDYRFHVNTVTLSKRNHGNIRVAVLHIPVLQKGKSPFLQSASLSLTLKKITLYVVNDSNHYEKEMNNEVHSFSKLLNRNNMEKLVLTQHLKKSQILLQPNPVCRFSFSFLHYLISKTYSFFHLIMYSIQLRILYTQPVLYLFKNLTEKLFKNTKK